MSSWTRLELRMRAIAESVSLDWALASQMTFADFSRAVAMRRAVRDSQRIAIAVCGRKAAAAS